MGIRRKIFVGFVIIGFILFLSGIISVFQLVEMEKSISGMLSDNVKSVEISTYMMDAVETQSWDILSVLTEQKTGEDAKIEFDEEAFTNLLDNARNNLTIKGEGEVVDSLAASFIMYHGAVNRLDSLFALPNLDERAKWYVDLYRPAYLQFNASIRKLKAINQNALSENSLKLERNFYQMLMPPIIAIAAGLFLIILFNYFINLYFIAPILAITKGIKLFLDSKISYSVNVATKDEINDLNEEVKVLISQFKRDVSNSGSNKYIIDFKNKP